MSDYNNNGNYQESEAGNGMAIAGFVLSLCGLGILGLIFSCIGLKSKRYHGLAVAGLVLGIIRLTATALCFIMIFIDQLSYASRM